MIQLLLVLIICMSLLCIGLVWLTYRRNKAMKMLRSTRIHIARDLHDEIGATLSSISFYSEAARIYMQKGEPAQALPLINKIGSSSRETIYSMNDIVWMINPGNDQLNKLFERIDDFGKSLFMPLGINFLLYSDPKINQLILPLEWRKNLYLIIKESMNNAAKYASCQTLEVLIKSKSNLIEVVIKDDGLGFDSTLQSKGNGLLNMRVRAADLGSKLQIESAKGKGTAISFNLEYPLNW